MELCTQFLPAPHAAYALSRNACASRSPHLSQSALYIVHTLAAHQASYTTWLVPVSAVMGSMVLFDIAMSVVHCCCCRGGGTAAAGAGAGGGGMGKVNGVPVGTVSSLYAMRLDDKQEVGGSATRPLPPPQQQVFVMHE